MRKRVFQLLLRLLFFVALSGGASAQETAPETTHEPPPSTASQEPSSAARQVAPAINVIRATKRLMTQQVIVSGLVAPVEMINVSPLVEGQQIEKLLVEVGDKVEKGQILAVLSKTTLELQKSQVIASLAAAKAAVAQAEAQQIEARSSADEVARINERTTKLKNQGSASQAAADAAQANAISAQARYNVALQSLEAARAQQSQAAAQLANIDLMLDRTEVRAPFGGEITNRNAIVGSIASAAGGAMFSIIRDGELELKADASETDLPQLRAGQKALLYFAGLDDPIEGSVRLVEPSVDTVTRLGRVRISIPREKAPHVVTGMYAQADVIALEREGVAVPLSAVSRNIESKDTEVLGVKDGVARSQSVEIGILDKNWVEILSGLQPGDVVVEKASAFVGNGQAIAPIFVTK